MTRRALLALCVSIVSLCCAATYPQQQAPQKPDLIIVHADWCAPCRIFDAIWLRDAVFREALQDAFTVRQLDWQVPSERAAAEAMGAKSLPTYMVFKGNRRIAVSVGFATSMNAQEVDSNIAELMNDLHVEWPRVCTRVNDVPPKSRPEPPRVVAPDPPRVNPGPTVDSEAREGIRNLSQEAKQLRDAQSKTQESVEGLTRDVSAVQSQVSQSREILSQQLQQSHESTRSELTTITDRLKESIERTILQAPPVVSPAVPVSPVPDGGKTGPDISTEMKTGPTASKWLSVLAWCGKTGLAIAAPEVAIPGSAALTVAGLAIQWIRRRRAARQPAPLGHSTNPIVVNDTGTKTETKFVVRQSDVLGESYAEAIRRVGNIHRESQPQIIDVLKQVDSAAQQLAHGRRVVRRPSTEPTSEN